jgi:hypothetical protein
MAFQQVPETARFALVHKGPLGDDVVNVLYFRRAGAWGLPELETAAQTLATAWVNDVMPSLSRSTSFQRVQARGERVQDDVSFEYVLPAPVLGSIDGDPLPPQVCFCITHLTGLVGRANRGRSYMGLLSENDVSAGILIEGRAIGLRNGLSGVRTVMANAGWTHVVVSRVRNKTRLPVAVTVPVIGYKYTDRVVDTQRRRQVGKGS